MKTNPRTLIAHKIILSGLTILAWMAPVYSLHPKIGIILASGTMTKKHQSHADFQLTTTHARCPFHFPCACTAYGWSACTAVVVRGVIFISKTGGPPKMTPIFGKLNFAHMMPIFGWREYFTKSLHMCLIDEVIE
jgi:hypothetical protein